MSLKNCELFRRDIELDKSLFKPYCNPDDKMQYIHTKSHHPPNIIK